MNLNGNPAQLPKRQSKILVVDDDKVVLKAVTQILDRAGYTSVVATNVEQQYHRELRPGDHVTAYFTIESISPVKQTALGEGCFLTLHKKYLDQEGDLLVEERFRLLRFQPKAAHSGGQEELA